MGYDFSETFAKLVLETNPDLTLRLESQEEALQEVKCINPLFGRWVDAHEVNYLLSVLALNDQDFAKMFPAMAQVTERERLRFAEALESHFDECSHCSLKRGYDLEMDARVEQSCRENNDFLLQVLREEETDSSEEMSRQEAELKRALKAHQ